MLMQKSSPVKGSVGYENNVLETELYLSPEFVNINWH
jgi:hypothetical protein